MTVSVLHYYRMKAEFLPLELPSLGIYVRPGELAEHVKPNHWDIVGPTYHPNHLQARDVQQQGFCLRPGVPEKPRGREWYLASRRAIEGVLKPKATQEAGV
jgi:hypothetical protein